MYLKDIIQGGNGMKYQELANILKKNIENGVYIGIEKLPTEENLIKQYQVSKYCVRNAIGILVELGLVYPVQGSGMYIRESKREGCLSLRNTKGLTAELTGHSIVTKVIKLEKILADSKIANRMKCRKGTPLYYIVRARSLDGNQLSVEYTYYNRELIPIIDEQIAEGSLFEYVKSDMGLNIGFADKILRCDKLNKETADLLGLPEGDPAIIIEDDAYLSNGIMFNASVVYYNYKIAKFFELAEMKW